MWRPRRPIFSPSLWRKLFYPPVSCIVRRRHLESVATEGIKIIFFLHQHRHCDTDFHLFARIFICIYLFSLSTRQQMSSDGPGPGPCTTRETLRDLRATRARLQTHDWYRVVVFVVQRVHAHRWTWPHRYRIRAHGVCRKIPIFKLLHTISVSCLRKTQLTRPKRRKTFFVLNWYQTQRPRIKSKNDLIFITSIVRKY